MTTMHCRRLPARRVAAAAVLLALAAAGCDRQQTAESDPAPTLTATPMRTASPTPTATPAPTEDPTTAADDPLRGVPPPELDIVGHADPERLAASHQAIRHWMYANPDPEDSLRVSHPECRCLADDTRLLTYYREASLWWTGGRS
jgi:hypothetical protein